MKKRVMCIYHGKCDDGFGAAWAVVQALGQDGVELYEGVYQRSPPDVTDHDVVMVDFSYKRPVIMEMNAQARSLLILDHHASARNDLSGLPQVKDMATGWHQWNDYLEGRDAAHSIAVEFDMDRSGAGMTWDFFHGRGTRPPLINYLEDRDLFRKALPGSDEFTIALRSYPQQMYLWSAINEGGVPRLIEEGKHLQRYYRQRVEEAKASAFTMKILGHVVPVANIPHYLASEVAGELAIGHPFAAGFWVSEGGRKVTFSLRSREGGLDVTTIAIPFGGGGHPRAAGFSIDSEFDVDADLTP